MMLKKKMNKIIGHAFLFVCGPEPLQILRRRQSMAAWPEEPGIKGPGRTPQMSHISWHHETPWKKHHKTTMKAPILQVSQVSVTFSWDFEFARCSKCFGRKKKNPSVPQTLGHFLGGFPWRFVAFFESIWASVVIWWKPDCRQQLVDGTPGLS